MITAVLTLGWGCSKSDGDDDPGNPQTEPEKEGGIQSQGRTWYPIDFENDWHVNFTPGNETKPDWKSPSAKVTFSANSTGIMSSPTTVGRMMVF